MKNIMLDTVKAADMSATVTCWWFPAVSRSDETWSNAILVARITYAISAWWGITTSDNRQCIEGFHRHKIWAGFYRTGWPTVENLVEDADDVFTNVSYIMKIMLYILCCPNETPWICTAMATP